MNITWRTLLGAPVFWVCVVLLGLTFGLPYLYPLFSALFPQLDRPIYTQDSFWQLLISHVGIVAASSLISIIIGVTLGAGFDVWFSGWFMRSLPVSFPVFLWCAAALSGFTVRY